MVWKLGVGCFVVVFGGLVWFLVVAWVLCFQVWVGVIYILGWIWFDCWVLGLIGWIWVLVVFWLLGFVAFSGMSSWVVFWWVEWSGGNLFAGFNVVFGGSGFGDSGVLV